MTNKTHYQMQKCFMDGNDHDDGGNGAEKRQ